MGHPVLFLVLTQIVNANNANIIANITARAREALPIAPIELLHNMLELMQLLASPSPSLLRAIQALRYWMTGKMQKC